MWNDSGERWRKEKSSFTASSKVLCEKKNHRSQQAPRCCVPLASCYIDTGWQLKRPRAPDGERVEKLELRWGTLSLTLHMLE